MKIYSITANDSILGPVLNPILKAIFCQKSFLTLSKKFCGLIMVIMVLLCGGCATVPYDYSNFKKYNPRSILVIPPNNRSTDVKASYSCLSTVSKPIAEMGYYVFPVAVIDEMFRQNGMPTPGEMNQVPLKKIAEIINPDAVMYMSVEEYGSKFQIINNETRVALSAKLVHTKTGTKLWDGKAEHAIANSNNSNGGFWGAVAVAMVDQVIDNSFDRARGVCEQANSILFTSKNTGLLPGPYYKGERTSE